MNHDDPDLVRQLEALRDGVHPTGGATDRVVAGVRRRQRRRRAGAAAAAVVAVAVVAGGATWVARPSTGPVPAVTTPSPSPEQTGELLFRCQRGLQPYADPPPIDDLAEQRAIIESLPDTRSISAWGLVHAEPTPLGVVALVVNATFAEPALTALGVSHVREWDPAGQESGLDERAQVRQVVGWQLDPVLASVRRDTGGIPGAAGLAYWHEAGAVVVRWKSPIPAEVRALAGERPDGVRVEVWPVDHSSADVRRAQDALQGWLERTGNRDRWASAYGCSDGTGLVVGLAPPLTDRARLQEELSAAVGMPVMVVEEERPVALGG